MASNSTSPSQGATGDEYECNMNNQCVTIISISTFFGVIFLCSICTICYRFYQNFFYIHDEFEEPSSAQQCQEHKENAPVQNPIHVAVSEEDPC